MEPEEHYVALKVMRLTRPTLSSVLPITSDSKDLPGNLLNESLQKDPTSVPGTETLAIGQFLLLPQNPVNIYLGETFSSYICVYSETDQVVDNVAVKVDLQTTSQRLALSSNSPTPTLNPDDTVNVVIHHEVKEIGAHILVCEVTYQAPNGVPMSFRKFFKIMVLKPLDVKTKFYSAKNDDVYIEAQVQNITSGPICLEKVDLDASHVFDVASLNSTPSGKSVFGKTVLLQPQSICQFLYCLTPCKKLSKDPKLLSGATNVGKLDIIWRSNLGEKGRLQTCQLQRLAPDYQDIRLSIIEIPNFVVLEKPFDFQCRILNNSERSVELILTLEDREGTTWCGTSGRALKAIPPKTSLDVDMKLIPLIPGLISVSGIKLFDPLLKRSYVFEDVGEVFVVLEEENSYIKPCNRGT